MKQLHCCAVRQFHITQDQVYFLILKNPALGLTNRGNQNQVKALLQHSSPQHSGVGIFRMDKMKELLLQDKLVEYAYRQLSGEKAPTFHKLLFVHAEDTSAGVLRAAMLQKGFDLILVSSIGEAKRRIFEDKEIELILCDLELPDGTATELFHTLRRVAGMFQMKNPPVRLLPFFILTENNDLATEYEYRHEGVNDYITAPVNIPELIRRVLFFVE